MDIAPGLNVDVIVDLSWLKETIDVRRATVYDVVGERIVLSQTSPPISKRYLGNRVIITLVRQEREGPVRYGVTAVPTEIIKDYRLSRSQTTQAIVMIRQPGLERFNLRMFYRVDLPSDSNMAIRLKREKVNIIDISIGGAKFTYKKMHSLKPGEIIRLDLEIEEKSFDVEARVVRILPVMGRMSRELETIAVQFLGLDRKIKDLLSRKIRYIERETRYREMFPESLA
ncbi:MAG: PilZ domain-containing protein [Deltaproteobacteria bacterium]|nr:PilZ domain-containing protein [Deltaproteobacteria bacterium]RLB90042.1 MAG: hypothetical protein DRH10_04800 [Deltaproteobacteria bacterium]RLB95490.1 MAG: hypothetical protein DRH50_04050 [Deltaproteobacteria bacterium]RLC12687.1 MAG: hypothetical protein DRH43_00910 [Deltaproteobacteria bacterium]